VFVEIFIGYIRKIILLKIKRKKKKEKKKS